MKMVTGSTDDGLCMASKADMYRAGDTYAALCNLAIIIEFSSVNGPHFQ